MTAWVTRFPLLTTSLGWTRLIQCIFVLLLALDLVGSPFHQHHHEGSTDSYLVHVDQHQGRYADSDNFAGLDYALSVSSDAEGADSGNHSLATIRSGSIKLDASRSSVAPQFLGSLFLLVSLAASPIATPVLQWCFDRSRPPVPLFRTVPPNGRAPPALNA